MRMMEMSIDDIVGVVAVRNGLMATTWTVNVSWLMLTTVVRGSADIGIPLAHRNYVFRHLATILLMTQLAAVEVIDVALMFDLNVPAIWTMNMTGLRR